MEMTSVYLKGEKCLKPILYGPLSPLYVMGRGRGHLMPRVYQTQTYLKEKFKNAIKKY